MHGQNKINTYITDVEKKERMMWMRELSERIKTTCAELNRHREKRHSVCECVPVCVQNLSVIQGYTV